MEDFEDLYEHAPVGYLSMQLDGLIVRVNETLADWTNQAKADLVGARFPELLTVGTRIFYETNVMPLLSMHGHFSEVALELRTANEGKLPVFAHAVCWTVANGLPVVRLIVTQARDRRRFERELIDAHTDAESSHVTAQGLLNNERETAHLREQFIAVLGHDLRNPLASISNGIHLLHRELPVERRQRVLEILGGSVVRMGKLIDNVLDLARGRLGSGIPLDLLPNVDLVPVIEQVVLELSVGASDRSVETDMALLQPITCDPLRIGQLVSNLLGNALAHGTSGGRVQVHADATSDTLTIWVTNSGTPIPPAQIELLFRPFFRGEVRSSMQGLGLGLYIASEIAKAHGGDLTVASTSVETRFTFTMPIANCT